MNKFKKAVSLVAVLVFLITALIPVSGLASGRAPAATLTALTSGDLALTAAGTAWNTVQTAGPTPLYVWSGTKIDTLSIVDTSTSNDETVAYVISDSPITSAPSGTNMVFTEGTGYKATIASGKTVTAPIYIATAATSTKVSYHVVYPVTAKITVVNAGEDGTGNTAIDGKLPVQYINATPLQLKASLAAVAEGAGAADSEGNRADVTIDGWPTVLQAADIEYAWKVNGTADSTNKTDTYTTDTDDATTGNGNTYSVKAAVKSGASNITDTAEIAAVAAAAEVTVTSVVNLYKATGAITGATTPDPEKPLEATAIAPTGSTAITLTTTLNTVIPGVGGAADMVDPVTPSGAAYHWTITAPSSLTGITWGSAAASLANAAAAGIDTNGALYLKVTDAATYEITCQPYDGTGGTPAAYDETDSVKLAQAITYKITASSASTVASLTVAGTKLVLAKAQTENPTLTTWKVTPKNAANEDFTASTAPTTAPTLEFINTEADPEAPYGNSVTTGDWAVTADVGSWPIASIGRTERMPATRLTATSGDVTAQSAADVTVTVADLYAKDPDSDDIVANTTTKDPEACALTVRESANAQATQALAAAWSADGETPLTGGNAPAGTFTWEIKKDGATVPEGVTCTAGDENAPSATVTIPADTDTAKYAGVYTVTCKSSLSNSCVATWTLNVPNAEANYTITANPTTAEVTMAETGPQTPSEISTLTVKNNGAAVTGTPVGGTVVVTQTDENGDIVETDPATIATGTITWNNDGTGKINITPIAAGTALVTITGPVTVNGTPIPNEELSNIEIRLSVLAANVTPPEATGTLDATVDGITNPLPIDQADSPIKVTLVDKGDNGAQDSANVGVLVLWINSNGIIVQRNVITQDAGAGATVGFNSWNLLVWKPVQSAARIIGPQEADVEGYAYPTTNAQAMSLVEGQALPQTVLDQAISGNPEDETTGQPIASGTITRSGPSNPVITYAAQGQTGPTLNLSVVQSTPLTITASVPAAAGETYTFQWFTDEACIHAAVDSTGTPSAAGPGTLSGNERRSTFSVPVTGTTVAGAPNTYYCKVIASATVGGNSVSSQSVGQVVNVNVVTVGTAILTVSPAEQDAVSGDTVQFTASVTGITNTPAKTCTFSLSAANGSAPGTPTVDPQTASYNATDNVWTATFNIPIPGSVNAPILYNVSASFSDSTAAPTGKTATINVTQPTGAVTIKPDPVSVGQNGSVPLTISTPTNTRKPSGTWSIAGVSNVTISNQTANGATLTASGATEGRYPGAVVFTYTEAVNGVIPPPVKVDLIITPALPVVTTGTIAWAMQIPDDPAVDYAAYGDADTWNLLSFDPLYMGNGQMPLPSTRTSGTGLPVMWHEVTLQGGDSIVGTSERTATTVMQVPVNSRFEINVPRSNFSTVAGTRNDYLEWEYRESGTQNNLPGGDVITIPANSGFYGVGVDTLVSGPVTANMDGLQYRLVHRVSSVAPADQEKTPWITLEVTGSDKTVEVPEVTISSAPAQEQNNVPVTETGTVTFTADVQTGLASANLAYQWQSRVAPTASAPNPAWTDLPGETNRTLILPDVKASQDDMSYRCVVSNNSFSGIAGTSNALTLKVDSVPGAVVITAPATPVVINRYTDKTASFAVEATTNNGDAVTYQWYRRASIAPIETTSVIATATEAAEYLSSHPTTQETVSGATSASYETQPLEEGVYEYVCRVTNSTQSNLSATSTGFFVIVTQRSRIPYFTEYPKAKDGVVSGSTWTMTCKAMVQSQEPLTYQWEATKDVDAQGVPQNWAPLTGQTSATLTIRNVGGDYNEWYFRCVAKNAAANTSTPSSACQLFIWNKADTPVVGSIMRRADENDKPVLVSTATLASGAPMKAVWTLDGVSTPYTQSPVEAVNGVYTSTLPTDILTDGVWTCTWTNESTANHAAGKLDPYVESNAYAYGTATNNLIVVAPVDVTAAVGTSATFEVGASIGNIGPLPTGLVYVWQRSQDGGLTWHNCTANDGSGQFTSRFTVSVTQATYDYATAANMQGYGNPYWFRVMVADRTYGNREYSDRAILYVTEGTEQTPAITVKDGVEGISISTDSTLGKILSGTALTVTKDGHKVSEVLDMLSWTPTGANYALRVLNNANEELTSDDVIGTDCKIQLIDPSNDNAVLETVTVVVRGDVMGSGVISLTQLVKMAAALKTTDPTKLEGAYLLAGDFDGNGEISLTDLVQEATIYRAEILDAGATPAPTPSATTTAAPTTEPTVAPTTEPTAAPTAESTAAPTVAPTESPSAAA